MNVKQFCLVLFVGSLIWAIAAGADLPVPSPTSRPSDQSAILSAGQAAGATTQPKNDLLGPEFISESYGLAFCPPLDCTEIHKPTPDTIVEFDQDKHQWRILARRVALDQPLPLTIHKDQFGDKKPGLLEATMQRITTNTPGAEIIADEAGPRIFNVGNVRIGAIFVRFVDAAQQRKLLLEAIVEAPNSDDRLYYFIDFIANARARDADPNAVDSGEKAAYDVFNQMIDSVRLLDLKKIVEDQRERLLHTRELFLNWSSHAGDPIKSALIPSQWQRVIKNGKDIGYSHIEEELDDSVRSPDGSKVSPITDPRKYIVRVAIRSRLFPTKASQWDTGSWMHTSVDRSDETWTSVARGTNGKGQLLDDLLQIGSSHEHEKTINLGNRRPNPDGGLMPSAPGEKNTGPLGQGNVDLIQARTLNVNTTLNKSQLDPFQQDLPVFYIPQAIGALLPSLVPLNHPRTYMFATFVATPWADLGKGKGGGRVMTRYIDVLPAAQVDLNNHSVLAVRITDHIGLSGPLTTHYMSPEGKFLGSVSLYSEGKDQNGVDQKVNLTILPCTQEELERLWPHPAFDAREHADEPKPAPQ